MNRMAKTTMLLFILIFTITRLSAQEFYEDGSMKLTEVSKDKKYGYESTQKASIKVGKIKNEYAFMEALLGPNGEPIQYRRLGSCCGFKSKAAPFGSGFLDKYEVYYEGLTETIILYINGYEYEDPKCPYGFTFKTADKIVKPVIFPQDSLVKVSFCDEENIYSVDKEFLLKEKVGNLPTVDQTPEFDGGIEALKKYFAENPLTDERAKDMTFRVAIGFVVNCQGEAGNFQILTKGKGEIETLANQVLGKVNSMPQSWKSAKKGKKLVDCYQVLSFTIVDGQLDKVSYR